MTGWGLLIAASICAALAAAIAVVAWRVAREEQRRSDARVAALAAEIHGAPRRSRLSHESTDASPLFAASVRPAPKGAGGMAAAGALACFALAALVVMLSAGTRQPTVDYAMEKSMNTSHEIAALELLALGQERDGDRLTVRGVVRDPAAGAPVDRLAAVVFAFDRQGAFVTSGRALVDTPALGPGRESGFAVTVPGASAVTRYRVSFRTGERLVPHVDTRPTNGQARVP